MVWAAVKRNRFILLFIVALSPFIYHFLLERERKYYRLFKSFAIIHASISTLSSVCSKDTNYIPKPGQTINVCTR